MNNQEIALRETSSLDVTLNEIAKMQQMAAKLMQTKHYQSMGEAGIFAILQKAKSLNMEPLDALNGSLYFVQGKIGMSSEMMASLIRQAGHSIVKDPKSNETICILHGKRKDNGDTWQCSFSMEDAKRAGLAKNMYDKYPAVMLYNRCMSMLARQLFPDVIKGAGYTHEELMEIKDSKVAPIQPMQEAAVEVVEEKKLITSEQALELQDFLKSCPKDFIVNVSKYIADTFGGFDKIEEKAYAPIVARIQSKLAEVEKANQEMNNAA